MTEEQLQTEFKKIIKKNPRGFDQNYLDQLELEVLDITEDENGWLKLKFVIHNFDYFEDHEGEIGCSDDKVFVREIYFGIISVSNLLRKDPAVRKLIDQAKEEAKKIVEQEREKEKNGKHPLLYRIFPFLMPRPHWSVCHEIWYEQKKILKEKYGIDWQSPQDRCPDAEFD